METPLQALTDEERAVYEWQMWTRDFGEAGQQALKNTTALVSRVGGLGGPVCLELAAAGIGRLIIAHGGNLKPSDLNRQILMSHEHLGTPRIEQAKARLLALNPRLEVSAVASNISKENVDRLVGEAGIVFDCAPLFEERFLLNRACVTQRKPMIDCAMFSMEGQVTTIVPGETPCLQCIYPEIPPGWKREFPVFGAVSCAAACYGVMEGIKHLSGMGASLKGQMLYFDMRNMTSYRLPLQRRPDCPICSQLWKVSPP
ncbi:MAG: HesA/MoeB/ThiF family protein [Candidatus Hydrogenedentes bacterium]|nr:HesA/MoeB/ThiF family protein [Candidatus Hydrogenedentota bacterium]